MKKTVIISILGVFALSSCKKDPVEPEKPKLSITNTQYSTFHPTADKLTGSWVKKKEYNASMEECSFTGIGKSTFKYAWYVGSNGVEHNSTSNDPVDITMYNYGQVTWSDGYDNFTLPTDTFTTYEIWYVTDTEMYVSTDDSPNILYYTKE